MAPAGECRHDKKKFYYFCFLFSGEGIFTYYKFSHLTNIFFIGKISYFSDIKFLQCTDFAKKSGKKIRMVLKPNMVGALELIFSQVYITRPWLQFCRPPKISRIFCFWESGSGQYLDGKTRKPKIWNAKFSKTKDSRKIGRPAEL